MESTAWQVAKEQQQFVDWEEGFCSGESPFVFEI